MRRESRVVANRTIPDMIIYERRNQASAAQQLS